MKYIELACGITRASRKVREHWRYAIPWIVGGALIFPALLLETKPPNYLMTALIEESLKFGAFVVLYHTLRGRIHWLVILSGVAFGFGIAEAFLFIFSYAGIAVKAAVSVIRATVVVQHFAYAFLPAAWYTLIKGNWSNWWMAVLPIAFSVGTFSHFWFNLTVESCGVW